MTANSKEREFRYICQWFSEFSELQREDFVPVLVDYLTKEEIYMNGVVNSLSAADCNDKPMSLYQCRIKLFKEWSPKWPEEMKLKLKEKIIELDAKIGEKLEKELSTTGKDNGFLPNGDENGDVKHDEKENDENLGNENGVTQQNAIEEIQPQIAEVEIVEQNIENKEEVEEEKISE